MMPQVSADVNVIALIGERGREVREFVRNQLGEEGLKRRSSSVATAELPALARSAAALAPPPSPSIFATADSTC